MAPLVKSPYEKLVDDRFLMTCCAYVCEEVIFFHPDDLPKMLRQYPDHGFIRLARTAPLSANKSEKWMSFEVLAT